MFDIPLPIQSLHTIAGRSIKNLLRKGNLYLQYMEIKKAYIGKIVSPNQARNRHENTYLIFLIPHGVMPNALVSQTRV